ncbi:MAG: DPP IV N-terminal domain-containing protein [Verrucomicrobiae bacterium]|nr:DPP IV N-terminal domain-containing protein [Verrucomicrobiae bacterium]
MAGNAYALDFLDGQKRLVWSPDSRWLVFNWPLRNDLFVVELARGQAYRLQPVGDYQPEAGIVVAPDAAGASGARGPTRPAIGVPSPGSGKLTWEEWSPDSRFFLYRYGKNQRAIYSCRRAPRHRGVKTVPTVSMDGCLRADG